MDWSCFHMRATLSANSTASVPHGSWMHACLPAARGSPQRHRQPNRPGEDLGALHATPRRARITMHVTARSKNMRSLTVKAQLEYFTLVGPGYDLFELC